MTAAGVAPFALRSFPRLPNAAVPRQATRDAILDLLRSAPGLTARGLAARLGVHESTIKYHLRVLCRSSHVAVRKAKGRRHHFLAGDATPDAFASAVLLHAKPARALYEAVVSNPGILLRDVPLVAQGCGSTLHYHARHLRAFGL